MFGFILGVLLTLSKSNYFRFIQQLRMKFSIKDFKQFGKIVVATAFFLSINLLSAAKKQPALVERVDPANWWVGMQYDTLELLISGANISKSTFNLTNSPSKILKQELSKNGNFIYLTVVIAPSQPAGNLVFSITNPLYKKPVPFNYPLLKRTGYMPKGVDASDNMYLLFPDRFANGDTSNDVNPKMNEKIVDRKALKLRHGGDLKGIQDHIGYLENLGVTALWINPVLENDQTKESYHGYAATDSYRIDRRFGSNEQFKQLSDQCHQKGIKMVWDVVYNHWGIDHILYKNLPDSNWVNWFSNFTRTSYRAETLLDPYASEYDKKMMSDAWFDNHMPDLNQKDPHLAKYLIQNSIWWIEYAGLDAFRIDTYAYPDQKFMRDLNVALRAEYPNIHIFGETWVQGSPIQAWFTEKNGLNKEFSSELIGVTDFQLYFAITKGLNENFGWEEGFRRIELTLSHDILYNDANRGVTFLDNHDLSRIYSVLNEDFEKWKIANAMLLTLRGIPCIYYGHEILMKNFANPDALVREDFPGGWPNDSINKFDYKNLVGKEKEAFDFTRTLLNWRKQNPWIGASKLTQFVPNDNTYIYFRTSGNQVLMCAYSMNDKPIEIDLARFAECLKGRTRGQNILNGNRVNLDGKITLDPKSATLIQLMK